MFCDFNIIFTEFLATFNKAEVFLVCESKYFLFLIDFDHLRLFFFDRHRLESDFFLFFYGRGQIF